MEEDIKKIEKEVDEFFNNHPFKLKVNIRRETLEKWKLEQSKSIKGEKIL